MNKTIVAILLLTGLSGCSSIYHPKDSHVPEGFLEKKIADKKYIISFEAYRRESWDELESYLFQRAEEFGAKNNFTNYGVSDIKRDKRSEYITVPAIVMPEAMGNCGNGCTISGSGMLSPEYQKEFQIKTVSGIFIYDQKSSDTETKLLKKLPGN